jgi:hypothetical protein
LIVWIMSGTVMGVGDGAWVATKNAAICATSAGGSIVCGSG